MASGMAAASKYDDESDTAVDRSAFTLLDMVRWGIAHPSAATDTLLEPSPLLRRADALLERLLAALREEFTDAASGALLAASTEE